KYSKLSNRRAAETFELEVAGLKYSATVGRSPDGRILELFLQNHKNGSQSDANARDSAAAASLALQHGCPLEILQRAVLRDPPGRPATPLGAAIDALTGGSTSCPPPLSSALRRHWPSSSVCCRPTGKARSLRPFTRCAVCSPASACHCTT